MSISLAHKSITIDVNNRNAPNVVAIANVNDKAVRYLDVALTASGEKLTFADCTVTATFATDGYLISDSVACTLNSTADVITVPLENFKSMSGFLAIEIKITNGETQVLNTPLTLKVMVTPSLAENSKINNQSAGSFVEISREVATARGGQSSLGARLDTADANLANKADKSTTLAGYGITDAYTKERTDQKLAQKLNSMPFDSEPKNNSPCYLTSGAAYNALLAKADKASTLAGYGITDAYTKNAVDALLANKANLVNSLNIFDFDEWANNLQKLSKPIAHGTLDELNFDEKSITFTATEKDTYTNSWQVSLAGTTKISVKPNTKYWVYYTVNNYACHSAVFFNGNHTDGALVFIKNGKGTFVTNNDTSFITIRFGTYNSGTFKVSKIMIAEKESIYLPNEVAEGVPEVADEILAFEKTTQTSLDGKYDSSNIESGTSTLTPYSTVADKIKSASCTYKTIGDIVIVSATVKMNAVTIGANSSYLLIDLPYKCISEDNVFCVGISNLGKLFKFAVPKNNTWLQFQSQNKTDYTFADGEQINVICLYKIK